MNSRFSLLVPKNGRSHHAHNAVDAGWLAKTLGLFYPAASTLTLYLALAVPESLRSALSAPLLPAYQAMLRSLSTAELQFLLLWAVLLQFIFGTLILSSGCAKSLGLAAAVLFHISLLPLGWWSLVNLLFIPPLAYLLAWSLPSLRR